MDQLEAASRPATKSCPFCAKTYVLEHAFRTHVVRCRLLKSQGDGEKLRAGATTGLRDLYALVSSLAAKVEQLEAKLDRVAARTPAKAHRLTHQELLSETATKARSLDEWLTAIDVGPEHLRLACEAGDATEVLRLLLEAACRKTAESCPFRKGDEPGAHVYVFTGEKWEALCSVNAEAVRRDLVQKLQRCFKSWQDEHVKHLQDEAISMTFTDNLLVVMSDNLGAGGSIIRSLREGITSAAPTVRPPKR